MKRKQKTLKKTNKRPRGRPKGSGAGKGKGTAPQRTYRMDDVHWAIIVRAAELSGEPIADFQRDTLLKRARKILREAGER